MAFFEIKDPNYNSDQIESEILNSLKDRNIPYEEEQKFVEKYSMEITRKKLYSNSLTRFKIFFNCMPRWIVRIVKIFPFYSPIRKFLKIND